MSQKIGVPLTDQISRLRTALMDIALSEPIPTPLGGWEFCRDIARDVLAELDADNTGVSVSAATERNDG